MKKSIFYVDGFNFYFGLKDRSKERPIWKNFYWINFVKFFSLFMQSDETLVKVNYFTARPKNQGKSERQGILLQCNKAISGDLLSLTYGKYMDKPMICKASAGCGKDFMHQEEKQTDVAIAVKMVEDCYNQAADKIYIVSGDTDLIPAIKLIRKIRPDIEIVVMFPPKRFNNEVTKLKCNTIKLIEYERYFKKAILENTVQLENGIYFTKPSSWGVIPAVTTAVSV